MCVCGGGLKMDEIASFRDHLCNAICSEDGIREAMSIPAYSIPNFLDSFTQGRPTRDARNGLIIYDALDKELQLPFVLKLIQGDDSQTPEQTNEAFNTLQRQFEVWREFGHCKMTAVYGYSADPNDSKRCIALACAAFTKDMTPLLLLLDSRNKTRHQFHLQVRIHIGFEISKILCHLHTSASHLVAIQHKLTPSDILIKPDYSVILINSGTSYVHPRQHPNAVRGIYNDIHLFGKLLFDIIVAPTSPSFRDWNKDAASEIRRLAEQAMQSSTTLYHPPLFISHILQDIHKIQFAFSHHIKTITEGVKDLPRICDNCKLTRTFGVYCRRHYYPHFICQSCFEFQLYERKQQLCCPLDACQTPFHTEDVLYVTSPFGLSGLIRNKFYKPPTNTSSPSSSLNFHHCPWEISVLFSSPLSAYNEELHSYQPIPQLDSAREKQMLYDIPGKIPFWFDCATRKCLASAVQRNSPCLHYSGHCEKNCLWFEDEAGGLDAIEPWELNLLMTYRQHQHQNNPNTTKTSSSFRLVFLAGCDSQGVGQMLVDDIGIPHVICSRQKARLSHPAAQTFARAFYQKLVSGRTVKDSFEAGKHAILTSQDVHDRKEEQNSYMLLPLHGDHNLPIFNPFAIDQQQRIFTDPPNIPQRIPNPPEYFVGREVDMYVLITEIMTRRLVTLYGTHSGLGTSSVAVCLSRYIYERRRSTKHIDDVLYVQRSWMEGNEISLLQSIYLQLLDEERIKPLEETAGVKDLINAIGDSDMLIVLDGFDLGIHSSATADMNDLKRFLYHLFRMTSNTRILVVAKARLELCFEGVSELPFQLKPLKIEPIIRLFLFHCPSLQHRRAQMSSFLAYATERNQSTITTLIFDKFGRGNPRRILDIASTYTWAQCEELISLIRALAE